MAPPELGPRRLLSCSAARAHRAPLMLGSLFLIQDSVRGRNDLVQKKLRELLDKKSAPKENTLSGAR